MRWLDTYPGTFNDFSLAQEVVSNAGAASGVLNTVQQVGGSVGVAVISVIYFDLFSANFSQV